MLYRDVPIGEVVSLGAHTAFALSVSDAGYS